MMWYVMMFSAIVLSHVQVTTAQTLTVALEWEAPTQDAQGQPLRDLEGYHVCIAAQSIPDDKTDADCTMRIVDNATPKTIVTQPITCPGQVCYFRVYAFDTAGNEGLLSNEVLVDRVPPGGIVLRINTVTVKP